MSRADEAAFPTSIESIQHGPRIGDICGGLTKREYFALEIYCAKINSPAIVEAAKALAPRCKLLSEFTKEVQRASIFEATELLAELERKSE